MVYGVVVCSIVCSVVLSCVCPFMVHLCLCCWLVLSVVFVFGMFDVLFRVCVSLLFLCPLMCQGFVCICIAFMSR